MIDEIPDAYVIFTNDDVPCYLSHWSEQEAWHKAELLHPKGLLQQTGWYCRQVKLQILDKSENEK